jgi:D-arabinose 1-dehydrogenase-like Zn-dependent alcohol dehydrogenase
MSNGLSVSLADLFVQNPFDSITKQQTKQTISASHDNLLSTGIPESIPSDVAAPLLCAGVTVFSPLSRAITKPNMKVGVAGIGGLGHLAIQFASKFHNSTTSVVAISHSPNKKSDAAKLGASDFANMADEADYSRTVGTLDVLLITSFYAHETLDKLISLLGPYGQAILVGLPEEALSFKAFSLVMGNKSIAGSLIGNTSEVESMLKFAAENDVKPWISTMPMEQCNEAIQLVRDGKPRFRIVLEKSTKTFEGENF